MRKSLIILTIIFSSTSIGWSQSKTYIDLEDLETNISNELTSLSLDLGNLLNLEDLLAINSELIADLESKIDYSYSTEETNQNNDIFNKLSNIKGIDVVYISKAMLGMMPNMNMPGVNIGDVAGKLESLEIYSSESTTATKALSNLSKTLLKGEQYETLMLIKDEDSKTGFYMKKTKSNNISEMLMITEEDGEATIIRFLGNFNIQDIKNITNQNKRNENATTSSNLARSREVERRAKEKEERAKAAERRAKAADERARLAEKRAKEAEDKARQRSK